VPAILSPTGSRRVHLEVFEGPLDLLLTLVQRQSLDITTVALAQVTDQYLRYLAVLAAVDAAGLAEFCEIAATLALIKSRALLPRPPEVVEAVEDEAEVLAERLRQYRRIRAAAEQLGQRERAGLRAYTRSAAAPELPRQLAPGQVSLDDLARAFEAALVEVVAEPAGEPALVRPNRVRLRDRLAAIRQLLVQRRRVTFRELLLGAAAPSRELIVVSFLAVLELWRRRMIQAVQSELFGEIVIELRPDAESQPGWANLEETFLDESDG
jgi:segregation and condensation protein A